jgi:hypothetical protein
MNLEQFNEFLDSVGSTILNPPIHPFKNEWKKIYESIKPHFYGEVPPSLDTAFPNEDEQILDYRKKTYQAKTESPVVKAITELHRLLSSAKHSVKCENLQMQELSENYKFGDVNLQEYIFSILVANRVLDPNAVVLIEPIGDGLTNDSVRLDIEMKIIQSDRIVFNDPEYKLLIYKGISKNKYATLGIENPLYYHIVTDMFYAQARAYGDKTMFEVIYEHNSAIMPWVTLGGRVVPKYDNYGNTFKIYKSDFSPAIPYLNDAAIFDNQHKSVMLATCFPIKFNEGIDCISCNGIGRAVDPKNTDMSITCKSCNGHGKTLSITPLAAYNLNPTTNKFGDNQQPIDPIRYYSPDVSTIQETNKVATESLNKAEHVLNINRSLKSAQSGVAKEMDREPEYIEVGKISNDVYSRYKDILKIIQALVFMDSDSPINVNAPISFDLKTEIELMQEFAASQQGLPIAIRYESYISYVDRRYNADPVARQIATICAMYNSVYLLTPDERVNMLASGQITERDAISAQFVFDAITELYYDDNVDILSGDFVGIKQAIDTKLQSRFEAVASVELPDVNMDEFNNANTVDEFNTPQANDIEAEAKANLKGSVGGVQGILQIQKSVTDGVTDYNAALAILDLIYGISLDDAKRILGTPRIIKPTA